MNIREQLIPIRTSRRSGKLITKVGFVTLHDTGNDGSTAQNNVDYYIRSANDIKASAHIFVDDKEAIMCIPAFDKAEKAWHVIYDRPVDNQLFGDDANDISIGVECCYFSNNKDRTLKAYKNYVEVVVQLLNFHKLNETKITTHDILDTYKVDPKNMLKVVGKTVNDLYSDIGKEYNMDWKEVVRGCATRPDDWIKCIEALSEMAKLNSNLGDIELAKYLPELIEKAYNFGKN